MKTLIEIEYIMATSLNTSPVHTAMMDFLEVKTLIDLFNELHREK